MPSFARDQDIGQYTDPMTLTAAVALITVTLNNSMEAAGVSATAIADAIDDAIVELRRIREGTSIVIGGDLKEVD